MSGSLGAKGSSILKSLLHPPPPCEEWLMKRKIGRDESGPPSTIPQKPNMKTPQIKSVDLKGFSSATALRDRNRKRLAISSRSRQKTARELSNQTIIMSTQSPKTSKSTSQSGKSS